VSVAEVVDADVEGDAGGFEGRQPDAGAERVARDWGAVAVANSRSSRPRRRVVIQSVSWATRSGGSAMVRASLSLG
jgi:hypothetical protein